MVEWRDGGGGGGGGEDLKCLTVLFLDQTHTFAGLHTPDARHNQHVVEYVIVGFYITLHLSSEQNVILNETDTEDMHLQVIITF